MAMQIVMDHTGDARHLFNSDDAEDLARAERRFNELTGAGFTAKIRSSDPTAKRLYFIRVWSAAKSGGH